MKADVYLDKTRQKILLLNPGGNVADLPEKAQKFAADLEFHDHWEIDPASPRIGLNQKEAIQSLELKGYYAATAHFRIEEVG